MPRNRHTVEQIITKLREAEVALSQRAARRAGLPHTGNYRTDLLPLAK